MPFNARTLRTMAWLAIGLCFLVGCSSADGRGTSGSSAAGQQPSGEHSVSAPGSSSPRPLVELEEHAVLAPGTYQLGYHLAADEVVPDAFVTVPSGYDEAATWFVVSHDGHEYLGLWTRGGRP